MQAGSPGIVHQGCEQFAKHRLSPAARMFGGGLPQTARETLKALVGFSEPSPVLLDCAMLGALSLDEVYIGITYVNKISEWPAWTGAQPQTPKPPKP